MSSQSAPADRAARVCLHLAFWLPLAGCTYMALAPSPPDTGFRISDIVLHALAFGYLTFALGLASPALRVPALIGWMLGYGLFIETVQSFQVERSAEIKDLLVDVAGILAGLALLELLGDWSRRTVRAVLRRSVGGR